MSDDRKGGEARRNVSPTDRPNLLDDDQLRAQLGLALDESDPVPEEAVLTAMSIFDLGDADAELAELMSDSMFNEARFVMRSDVSTEVRSLSFATGSCRIDIELSADGTMLTGQLHPVERAVVQLETTSSRSQFEADDLGRFRFRIERGSLRLRVLFDISSLVTTPWIIW